VQAAGRQANAAAGLPRPGPRPLRARPRPLARHRAEAEGIVEFAIGQQARIGSGGGAAKLERQSAVEIEFVLLGLAGRSRPPRSARSLAVWIAPPAHPDDARGFGEASRCRELAD
jgi:hypothetical protein